MKLCSGETSHATIDAALLDLKEAAARDLGAHILDELMRKLLQNARMCRRRRDAFDRDVVAREFLAE